MLRKASLVEKRIQESPANDKKILDRKFPHEKPHIVILRMYQRAELQRPAMVCVNCGGDGCKVCAETGYWSVEEYEREKKRM
jgi:hypothetical protein